MKLKRFTTLLTTAVILLLTTISCTKDEGCTPESGEVGQVEISITGDFNDFGTKAEIENIFRMTWAANDNVYVYGKASGAAVFSCLGTLVATPDTETGNRVADLKGTITAPKANTKLTLVYSPLLSSAPAVSDGAISIGLSSQSGGANDVTFVSYTTVDYKGATDATYRTSFSFATSVLRANVINLSAGTELTKAMLGGIETNCKLTFAEAAAPTVAGDNATGTITKTFTGCSSNAKGYAAFYMAVPVITENANRALTVTQSGNEYDAYGFATGSKNAGSIMNSIAELITTGQRGVLNGQDYVLIKAKYDGTNYSYLKWATQNLAVTESGKAKWKGTNYVIGDYFQWAASYAGYGITEAASKKPDSLVIYDSFKNTGKGNAEDSFAFKTGKTFASVTPYYGSGSAPIITYTKYSNQSETLELTDDVANIVLGGTWRMPTGGSTGQFYAMKNATMWTWNDQDLGYYVTRKGENLASDKSNALLFFPAAGYGLQTTLYQATEYCSYWSSTLSSSQNAYYFNAFNNTISSVNRYYGCSVRPVSD